MFTNDYCSRMGLSGVREWVVKPDARLGEIGCIMSRQCEAVMSRSCCYDAVLPGH
jgi:hypothetical protein